MNRITAMLPLLVVAACSSTPQQPPPASPASPSRPPASGTVLTLTDAQRSQIQSAVRARIGNEAATFRTIIAQRDANDAITVCGYVNPGTGDAPFIGMLGSDGFTVADVGGTTERTLAVQHACHARGIYT